MLDSSSIDLEMLVTALEDHSYESSWWLDPATGAVEYCSVDDDPEEFESRGLVYVHPGDSREAYQDMVDFAHLVGDERARDLLFRSLEGRGAFRRFKDTLLEFPKLREQWFSFHDLRMQRRAIEWLTAAKLITEEVAQQALMELDDEPETIGPPSAATIAGQAAAELRDLYEDRLVRVVLYGSHARGEAGPGSDIDLLVVLCEMDSPWEELRRMDELLWRLSLAYGVTLSALPVAEPQFDRSDKPVLIEARSHGMTVL